jgi:hypothetical protein
MKITQLLDRPIAYHRVFVTLTGSTKAAIMLSQAVYWQPRAKQKDGWWYKTAEEWEEETGLTYNEQRTARKECEKYLLSDLRGIPATLHWKVDEDALQADLLDGNQQSSMLESKELVSDKVENINMYSETTTETTTLEGNDKKNLPITWKIAGGLPITQDDLDRESIGKIATQTFERAFGFGELPWDSTTVWQKFYKFIVRVYSENPNEFQGYADWRKDRGKYSAFSNRKIRENPQAFMDTGWPEYDASKMYNNYAGPAEHKL